MISNLDTASNSNFYGASNNPYVPVSRVNSPVNSPTFNAPPLANSMHYPNLSQINFRPSATTPIRNSFSRTQEDFLLIVMFSMKECEICS